jgi:hypothetical protein
VADYKSFSHLPETTPEEIDRKIKAYKKFLDGNGYIFLKAVADLQVAQFFIPKTKANKEQLITDAEYRLVLRGYNSRQSMQVAMATVTALENRFFHWFIEFPQVFSEGGFDCILGNPPFLGGQKLSGTFGDSFLEFIKYEYAPIGAVDLVTYFFRRIFSLIKKDGFQSLISTNTIAQGKAREGGLDVIKEKGGTINHAIRSMRWPGVAAVEVSLITITKRVWDKKYFLDNKEVQTITPYLDDSLVIGNPYPLMANAKKSFQGSIVLGKGFVLSQEEAETLIIKDPRNKDVLFPYLNGDDLNNDPEQRPSRWVINFFDWSEEKARTYPDCFGILEERVKPERQRWKTDEDGNEIVGTYALRKPLPQKWWIYGEKRPALYETISQLDQVMAIALTSKTVAIAMLPSNLVFSHSLGVFASDDFYLFSCLQSTFHNIWAWSYGSSMKSDLRYTPSVCFETFPFPIEVSGLQRNHLRIIGMQYNKYRIQVMEALEIGLTKVYNLFHNSDIDIQKIVQLRELHEKMDDAVLGLYGWTDLKLCHGFYDLEYLPENDRKRYGIHPQIRREIQKRLLILNHQLHRDELPNQLHRMSKNEEKKGSASTLF